jgi:hypothetical protein
MTARTVLRIARSSSLMSTSLPYTSSGACAVFVARVGVVRSEEGADAGLGAPDE